MSPGDFPIFQNFFQKLSHVAESLPFTKKNPTLAPAGNFFVQKSENPFLSYLDHQNRRTEVRR